MSRQQRRRSQTKVRQGDGASNDLWHTPAPLPPLERVRPTDDATALIRSLGDPPLNPGLQAGYKFGAVVEETSKLATGMLTFLAPALLDERD